MRNSDRSAGTADRFLPGTSWYCVLDPHASDEEPVDDDENGGGTERSSDASDWHLDRRGGDTAIEADCLGDASADRKGEHCRPHSNDRIAKFVETGSYKGVDEENRSSEDRKNDEGTGRIGHEDAPGESDSCAVE